MWDVLILAAGRGPDDPMAKAYGVANKCLIPVAGVPMLKRVSDTIAASGVASRIVVSIEDPEVVRNLLGTKATAVRSANSAPASVMAAVAAHAVAYPVLVTTADHALLTPDMVRHFCAGAEAAGADFCAGIVRAETIRAAYPQTARTIVRLGHDHIKGSNLFALHNDKALKLLERWQYLEHVRKKPWRLVAAFGLPVLFQFLLGRLTLDRAFAIASRRLGLDAKPVIMPFAEAAIDVDKPADKELAEQILAARARA